MNVTNNNSCIGWKRLKDGPPPVGMMVECLLTNGAFIILEMEELRIETTTMECVVESYTGQLHWIEPFQNLLEIYYDDVLAWRRLPDLHELLETGLVTMAEMKDMLHKETMS